MNVMEISTQAACAFSTLENMAIT